MKTTHYKVHALFKSNSVEFNNYVVPATNKRDAIRQAKEKCGKKPSEMDFIARPYRG